MDEIALMQFAQQGDLDAFNRLVLAYQEMVYNQAYRVMGEPDAAEDATQEAFISAYRKIHTYRGGSFKAWLLRIVTNACYDELRRRKRRPTTPLEPTDDFDEENSRGFGLMLIKMTAKQLGGTFSIDGSNGLKSTIEFNL